MRAADSYNLSRIGSIPGVPGFWEPGAMSEPGPDYTADGVPTFDYVRDRISRRAATADGADELDAATPEAHDLAQREAERAEAARAKLEEIRRSLG